MQLDAFILPVVFIAAGMILLFTSTVKINSIYGFRTKTSSKNEHTWKYCNQLCAKIMITTGAVSIVALCRATKVKTSGMFSIGEIVNISVRILLEGEGFCVAEASDWKV